MFDKKTCKIEFKHMSCYLCDKKFKINDIVCLADNQETICHCKTLNEAKEYNFDEEIGVITKITDVKQHPNAFRHFIIKWWNGQNGKRSYHELCHLKCQRENFYADYVDCDEKKFG